ncbi:single-stranded-DNA-specific exonuclease RecJ [Butyrivibrio sp. NC2002]|uniref:single-stranded-DNA-specific exonuclease RecJ n=1 Tax=Butyrivibrio sp. NC2002 TaxID=1410610 RepID=UPI00055CA25A|nr:single-stranded-DNA-specific exonuclease RecJ [Butyrivibrio sp. NC2002]
MANWFITRKGADFNKIAAENGISPITARILRNRDVYEQEKIKSFLTADIDSLSRPELLPDMEKAVLVMQNAIENNSRIRIIGDYDVDGICSSYILQRGIEACGGKVDVRLPHRMNDGYGLSMGLVERAHEDGIDTLITCDNGIAAINEISYAKELGMTVIVTDHHEVGYEEDDHEKMVLPAADAVVDPKRFDNDPENFKEICGAQVAYKFVWLLIETMGITVTERFMKDLRIFAGWATVCDVMPLTDENRTMVIDSMRNIPGTENVGLKQLIRATELDEYNISCYSYGFILGPCLNASGRLDSAMRGLELLMESNSNVAAKYAEDLKKLNDSRKQMTLEGTSKALAKLEEYGDDLPDVVVIYLPDLHESLAGIIAGKVREAVSRPVFIITDAENGGVKGSGRSIEKYHMFEELSKCKDLLTKFGGHKMAAGFSLEKENIDAFRDALNANSTLKPEDFVEDLRLDMELPLGYLNIPLVREFEKLAPFGIDNPEPKFVARNVELISGKIIGKNQNVGKYKVRDINSEVIDMILFGKTNEFNSFLDETFGVDMRDRLYNGKSHDKMMINVAYKTDINEFRGEENLQIMLLDYKKISS